MKSILFGAFVFALTAGTASAGEQQNAGPPAGRVPVLTYGAAFGTGSGVVTTPRWLPDSDPLMRALGVRSAAGLGSVIIEAKITDTRYYYAFTGPQVRALIKNDPLAVQHETSSWYLTTWTPAIRGLLVPGSNAVYIARNVPEPTDGRPLAFVLIAGGTDESGSVPIPSSVDFHSPPIAGYSTLTDHDAPSSRP